MDPLASDGVDVDTMVVVTCGEVDTVLIIMSSVSGVTLSVGSVDVEVAFDTDVWFLFVSVTSIGCAVVVL